MPWITKITGTMDPFPAYTTTVPQQKWASVPSTALDQAFYQVWQHTPSFNMVLPVIGAMDPDHVLVRTPSRSYTVAQQTELLQDMGDGVMVSYNACLLASQGASGADKRHSTPLIF
jgi:hypothetical protein